MQGLLNALIGTFFKQFRLCNKIVSKLGIAEWKHVHFCKFFYVSEFGKAVVTSTKAENGFLGPKQCYSCKLDFIIT
jgi:hypothetical protein